MNHLDISVIICTADRPQDLGSFLNSLEKQTLLPKQLIVVDSSSDPVGTQRLVLQFSKSTGICSQHIQSLRGLTIQRNKGISSVLEGVDIISFFDDDVELKANYLESIAAIFESDENARIGGVGGKIITPILESHTNHTVLNRLVSFFLSVLYRFFILASSKTYAILLSGINVSNEHKASNDTTAEWLHGCTSYRRIVFDHFLFDDSLVDYSMREDVDFSFRVSKRYKLVYTPSAEMFHHHSDVQRASAEEFGKMDIESWHWFVSKNMPKLINRICFWWAAPGHIIILLFSALLYNRRIDYLRAVGGIKGFLDILKPQAKQTHEAL